MRASRLLSILLLLQVRGRMTAEALAAEFEVSVRSIYRDIDHLSAAGVPVYAEQGRNGGYRLLDGYRTRLTGLNAVEAETLFLAGLPGPAAELGLAEVMAAAQLKLRAALPAALQGEAGHVAARFHLDPVDWYKAGERHDCLPLIADAVWRGRRLSIRYKSWKGEVSRLLSPLGLVLKAGIWYLVARVDDQSRIYRVSNITKLAVRDDGFKRPRDFDLAAFWQEAACRFEAGLKRGIAKLRLSSKARAQLPELGNAVADAAERSASAADARGWVQVSIPIESIEHATRTLLQLGAEAEVLHPRELRQHMAREAKRLARIYG